MIFLLLRFSLPSLVAFVSFLAAFFAALAAAPSSAASCLTFLSFFDDDEVPRRAGAGSGLGLRLLATLSVRARSTVGTTARPPCCARCDGCAASTPCRGMPVPTPSSSSLSRPESESSLASAAPRGAGDADASRSSSSSESEPDEPVSLSLSRPRLRLLSRVVRTLLLTSDASGSGLAEREGWCAERAASAEGENGSARSEPVQDRSELLVVRLRARYRVSKQLR